MVLSFYKNASSVKIQEAVFEVRMKLKSFKYDVEFSICEKESITDIMNYLHTNSHAEEEELDERFSRLYNELFTEYDRSKCRNCCKMYKGTLEEQEIIRADRVWR